jgi:hypothetical protein
LPSNGEDGRTCCLIFHREELPKKILHMKLGLTKQLRKDLGKQNGVLDTFVINLQMYLSQISASQNVFEKGASTATVAKYFLSNKESLDSKYQ